MGTKVNSNYEDLISFVRASSSGRATALRPVSYGSNELPSASFSTLLTGTWDGTEFVDTVGSQIRPGITSNTSLTNGKTYALFINITDITGATQVRIDGLDGTDRLIGEGDHRISFTSNGGTPRIRLEDTSTSVNDGFTVQSAITAKEVTFDQPDGTLTLFEHPENVPRVEYDADGNRLGLLVEEARTNLLTYSEDFTVQSGRWANGQKGDTSLTSGLTESPSMSDSVWKLFATSGTGTQIIQEDATVSGATNVVGSVYLKKAEYKYGGIRLLDSSPSTGYSVFIDLDDGSVFDTSTRGTPTTSDYRVQDAGNGWWRLSVITSSDGGSVNFTVGISDGTSINSFDCVSFAGDGTSGIYIWGAQVEEGSFPTSYIKSNSGSTTTRSADVASIPVADFGYNQSEGTVFVEASHFDTDSGTSQIVYLGDDTQDYVSVYTQYGSYYRVNSLGNGVSSGNIVLNTGGSLSDISKVATSWKNDASFDAARDGTLGTGYTDFNALGTVPTNVYFGTRNGSASPLNGHIKSIKYYPRRLTNAQLVQLTS
jgi:hypothetical protein